MPRSPRRRRRTSRRQLFWPLLVGLGVVLVAAGLYQFFPGIGQLLKTQLPTGAEDRPLIKYIYNDGTVCYDNNTAFCEQDFMRLSAERGYHGRTHITQRQEMGFIKSRPTGAYTIPLTGCMWETIYFLAWPGEYHTLQRCNGGAPSTIKTVLGYLSPSPQGPAALPLYACNHSHATHYREECPAPILNYPTPLVAYFEPPQSAPHGHVDVINTELVAGWACDVDAPAQPIVIEVWGDAPAGIGTKIGQVEAAAPREPAVANACAGQANHGFSFTIPELWRSHAMYVYAHNVGSHYGPVLIGNSLPSPPRGSLNQVTATEVVGYACDLDDPARPITVHFYADGPAGTGTIIGSVDANQPRDATVALACGGNGNHGFRFTIPAPWQRHSIYAYAINIGSPSDNVLIGNSIPNVPRGKVLGIQNDTVVGYACDLDDPEAPIAVHFYADGPAGGGGTIINGITADAPLGDEVVSACAGQANHGFFFPLPEQWRGHAVYAYAINIGTPGHNPLIGNTTSNIAKGHVDSVTSTAVSGWTCDLDRPQQPVAVHVYVDGPAGVGTLIGAATANLTRPDLVGECGGTTNHGFTFNLAPAQAGRALYVYAINIGSPNPNPLIGSYTPPPGTIPVLPGGGSGGGQLDPGQVDTLAQLCAAVARECSAGNQLMCAAYDRYCPRPNQPLPPVPPGPPPAEPPPPPTNPGDPPTDPEACMRWYCANLEPECEEQGYEIEEPGDACDLWGMCIRGDFDIPPECRAPGEGENEGVGGDVAVPPDVPNQPQLPTVPGTTLGGEAPGTGSCNLTPAEAIRRQIAYLECYQGCDETHLACREQAAKEPVPVLRDLRDKACFAETAECGQGCEAAKNAC